MWPGSLWELRQITAISESFWGFGVLCWIAALKDLRKYLLQRTAKKRKIPSTFAMAYQFTQRARNPATVVILRLSQQSSHTFFITRRRGYEWALAQKERDIAALLLLDDLFTKNRSQKRPNELPTAGFAHHFLR